MRSDRPTSMFVAPLRIRKTSDDESDVAQDSPRRIDTFNSTSPPLTLPSSGRFHNYLRALYPFNPASPHSSTTITLPLNAGDIVLVHSVHVNGWADGTLLDTGARGWLPTNYCEAYDYDAMKPLLRALTEFWDIVRCGTDSNINMFRSQDYMRGLVAGVRTLLEKSACLTRDSLMVKGHEPIRRTRKCLLSDLAMLVKAAKHLQEIILAQNAHFELDILLDDMLLKAFRIVTRAVLFYDVWSEHVVGPRSPDGALDTSTSTILQSRAEALADLQSSPRRNEVRHSGTSPLSKRHSIASPVQTTITQQRTSVTHRMSYGTKSVRKDSSLISSLLHISYDEFLTVLASFLGSHMQSRSSADLLHTTQNAVQSCRQLFAVVEAVIERDEHTSLPLIQAKDSMYYAITELVHAAREVFKPLHSIEEDLIYLPEEAHNLVQAATACVSAAGRCVARTKATLEDIGDFEIENATELFGRTSNGSSSQGAAGRGSSGRSVPSTSTLTPQRLETSESGPKKPPRISILVSTPPLSTHPASPSTTYGSAPPTPRDDVIADLVRTSPKTISSPRFGEPVTSTTDLKDHKPIVRTIPESASSDSSSDLVNRRSDPSNLSSASTRVTSFYGDPGLSFGSSPQLGSSDDEAAEAEILTHTFDQELVFNRDGCIIGGSLNALVERLTSHDSTPDVTFVTTMYLTFRLFATPDEFAQALIFRFEYIGENASIAGPVRLRVYNVVKGWMESHWRHDCDDTALPLLVGFAREDLAPVLPMAGKRILELAEKVSCTTLPLVPRSVSAMGKTNTSYMDSNAPLPSPNVSKSQLASLQAWKLGGAGVSILDLDPLELARQITLKTSKIFCSILPEELLGTEWTKRSSSLAVNVRAMSTLSTDLSNLVSDSILQLEEPKKRAAVLKQWVKIANRCLEIHNYDTLMAIVCAIDSTNIKRLRKTWETVPHKTKSIFDELRKVVDISRNYAVLRQRVQSHVPPCLPFIGVYLTDLTMVDSANPSNRPLGGNDSKTSVINLDKHLKTAKIISALQNFQVPFKFVEIPEMQTWMQDQLIRVRAEGEKSFHQHYRRSLILEPKAIARAASGESGKEKEKFDFLNWTHLLQKDKSLTVPT